MTKSYFPHLSSILIMHVLFLTGTWQLSQSEFVTTQMKSVGSGVMKIQIASQVMRSQLVQKKSERSLPLSPLKPKTQEVKQETVSSEITPAQMTEGSQFGSSLKGKSDVLSVYKAELRAMIDRNKHYPLMSRRLGQQGIVVVAFTLLEDGHIIDVKLEKPSPYERLNASAVDAVRKVERFRPIPKEIGESKMDFKVPVKFFTI